MKILDWILAVVVVLVLGHLLHNVVENGKLQRLTNENSKAERLQSKILEAEGQ